MTKDIAERAKQKGLSPDLVRARIRRGWPVEKALNTPVMDPSAAARKGGRNSPWGREPLNLTGGAVAPKPKR